MSESEIQIGPIPDQRKIGLAKAHLIRVYAKDFVPPLWFLFADNLQPRGESSEKFAIEINGDKFMGLIAHPYRIFENDPYFGPYVSSMDQLRREIVAMVFRDVKTFLGIPVTITFKEVTKSIEEQEELFSAFQTIWDLTEEVLGYRISVDEFRQEFNEITGRWTGGFQFTGSLQKDVELAGSPKNLAARALGTIQNYPELEFRIFSAISAALPLA